MTSLAVALSRPSARLIEQPKRRVAKEEACKGQATGLAARKTETAFAKRCAEPFRQSLDIRKQPRGDKRFAQPASLASGLASRRLPSSVS